MYVRGRALLLFLTMIESQKRQFSHINIYGCWAFSGLQFMRQGVHQVKTKRDLTTTSEQPSKKRPAVTLSGSDLGFLKPTIAKRDFRKIREYIDTHGFGPTTPKPQNPKTPYQCIIFII